MTRYGLSINLGGMDAMPLKRFTLHLDTEDMKRLTRLAEQEFRTSGVKVGVAGILRRLIKGYLATMSEGGKRGR